MSRASLLARLDGGVARPVDDFDGRDAAQSGLELAPLTFRTLALPQAGRAFLGFLEAPEPRGMALVEAKDADACEQRDRFGERAVSEAFELGVHAFGEHAAVHVAHVAA